MKILPLFTRSRVVSLFCWTQRKIFWQFWPYGGK